MSTDVQLPSVETLFGELDLKKGDDARAVYSPAAYLVDLLQLLDDKFTALTLDQRRPDIKQDLLLDGENTFTEMPYLDIVNTVLAKQIGDEADETLRTARYPFALPVHLAYEQVKTLLGHVDKKETDLYTLFAQQPDNNEVARTFLGLSHEAYTLVTTTPANGSALYADYGNNQAPDPTAGDISSVQFFKDIGLIAAETNSDQPAEPEIEQFLKVTGLTGSGLRELLQQNLSSDEQTQGLAASFFINHNLHGYVRLTDDETALCWSAAASPIPWQWFERVNRFVRLAQWIGFSFTELDLILRDCCGNQLDAAALRTIAVVKQLRDRYELPVDRLCSLFAPINTVGMGNEKTPHDLFHRIFNVRWTPIDHTYLLPWDSKDSVNHPLPPFLKDCTRLTCNGDILSLNGKPYRLRVAKALGMTDADITAVVTRFRTKYSDLPTYPLHPETDWSNHELSLLHRLATLAEMLDSSVGELLGLLDLLETDPALRKENSFGLLIPTSGEAGEPQRDGYCSLAEGTVADQLWLVQTICALTVWMQENDFTAAELKQITNGQPQDVAAQREQQKQKIEALTNLYQQCKPLLLTADLFVSERFDARAARVIHRTLVESDSGLTAKADPRLLRFAAEPAAAVAQDALRRLSTISAADFTHLGLEERLLTKLYANLILMGYLDSEGLLREEKLPAHADAFTLATDFSHQREALFQIIHHFYLEDQENIDRLEEASIEDEDGAEVSDELTEEASLPDDALIELALFPADLDDLADLTAAQRDELYANLIYNGYLDEEGNVLMVDFFADPANVDEFQVNVAMGDAAAQIDALIQQQRQRFAGQALVLDITAFDELPLTPGEVDDLVENLRFNGYLDEQNRFVDKEALLTQRVAHFPLALTFYPHRRAILAALQEQIATFKAQFCTFPREAFAAIADTVTAQQVYQRLRESYLHDDITPLEQKAFFSDADHRTDFDLGSPLTGAEQTAIFERIATIFGAIQPYELARDLLTAFDFDDAETTELLEMLRESGVLADDLMLAADQVAYFLNINNALTFTIEAFEDYNKDIFFALHTVAQAIDAAVTEIGEKLQRQAASQEEALFAALQDAFGVDEALLRVICRHVMGSLDRVVEEWLLPILATVDVNDSVAHEPLDNRFNFRYRHMQQFAWLAAKLGLTATETEIAFRDQDLAQKYPETLTLPPALDRFDALLEGPDGVIYIFKDNQYWTYSAATYSLLEQTDHNIKTPSERLAVLTKVDAAFVDANGTAHLIGRDADAHSHYFTKAKGRQHWLPKVRTWGEVKSNFADPARIDAAFQDSDGKLYLFSGDQYVRYSGTDAEFVDEGYPRAIAGNWAQEGLNAQLPRRFQQAIDAALQGADGMSYLFKDNVYVSTDAPTRELPINSKWGRVRNQFAEATRLDAAYVDGAQLYCFSGDQLVLYDDSIENAGVVVRQGFPQRIEAHFVGLPAEFESNLECVFKGLDGKTHFFKDGKTVALNGNGATDPIQPEAVAPQWGRVINRITENGLIDAAFVGLDGYTYLFSGDQYVHYAGADYTQVDEGYPRLIAGD